MAKVLPNISPALKDWLQSQKLFFVGTAPKQSDGHINISPKGVDTFRILSETTVAYLDLTGSGSETIAHVRENERIVLMFCAFDGSPKIVRIHGKGQILLPTTSAFQEIIQQFPYVEGIRSIIHVSANRISTSCGYGVPLFSYQGERDMLKTWAEKKGREGLEQYKQKHNTTSIDGLPALDIEVTSEVG